MAVAARRVLLTGTPTPLSVRSETDDDFKPGWSVAVSNPGPASVYLGGDDVDAAEGFELLAGLTFAAELGRGDFLYGFVSTADQEVHVIETGVL